MMMYTREQNNNNGEGRDQEREGLIAVAIDKDKSSQQALKWATEHVIRRGQSIKLIHVISKSSLNNLSYSSGNDERTVEQQPDSQTMDLFLPFRCFCMRRHVQCELVVLERQDVARALIEYVYQYGVGTLLLGSPSKNGLTRLFKAADIPATVLKWAPDFCNVYIVSKGHCSAVRAASRPVPPISSDAPVTPRNRIVEAATSAMRSYDEFSTVDMDVSFESSGRTSTDSSCLAFYDNLGLNLNRTSLGRLSVNGDQATRGSSSSSQRPPVDLSYLDDDEFPTNSLDIGRTSCSSQNMAMEDMEDEMRRLKIELKQTMDMYHAACKEALAEKQKAVELEQWKARAEKRLQHVELAEEREKTKCKAATEAAESAKKMMELEVQKRVSAELKAFKEAEEKTKVLNALGHSHIVLKYQSLFHISVVLFLFYFYFSISGRLIK